MYFSRTVSQKFLLFLAPLIFYSCEKPHQKENYLPIIRELHQIECKQLLDAGIDFTVNDTNIYTFRGIAFDRLMTKKPDAILIAHYEDLNQKLAAMEYFMDSEEKEAYHLATKQEYLTPCK